MYGNAVRRGVGGVLGAICGRRLAFALVLVALTFSVPLAVVAKSLNSWDSSGSPADLSLSASPGETVSGWAGVSLTWEARTLDEPASSDTPGIDEEGTTLPTPHAVSAMTLRMPSPWDEGQYVWDAYRIVFEAPIEPGEYRYVVKRAAVEAGSGEEPDITIHLKVD